MRRIFASNGQCTFSFCALLRKTSKNFNRTVSYSLSAKYSAAFNSGPWPTKKVEKKSHLPYHFLHFPVLSSKALP
jgi:hypothetical protein